MDCNLHRGHGDAEKQFRARLAVADARPNRTLRGYQMLLKDGSRATLRLMLHGTSSGPLRSLISTRGTTKRFKKTANRCMIT